jgi:hypothetical protein
VLQAAFLPGGAVVGPGHARAGGGCGQDDPPPPLGGQVQVTLAEHDRLRGAQGGVVEADVEGFQVLPPAAESRTAASSFLAWAGLTTTRRSTLWATAGVVHWMRSTGLVAKWPCSTASTTSGQLGQARGSSLKTRLVGA